jgi:glycosyltransferase involved in cell wall biosynthesis
VIVTRDAIDREPGVTVLRNVAPNSPELLECFRSSDIFALPSFADCFALVGMEALAAGLPLVATRVGGIPEMVEDGVTGYLFDPGDDAALAERLLALVESATLRQRMSSAARSHAERHFDAITNAQTLLSFVRSRC